MFQELLIFKKNEENQSIFVLDKRTLREKYWK
jgi:hypothetical protein